MGSSRGTETVLDPPPEPADTVRIVKARSRASGLCLSNSAQMLSSVELCKLGLRVGGGGENTIAILHSGAISCFGEAEVAQMEDSSQRAKEEVLFFRNQSNDIHSRL